MVDFTNKKNDLIEKDFIWAKYLSDTEIVSSDIRGVFIGNYFKWDGHKNYLLSKENIIGESQNMGLKEHIENIRT